MEIQISLWFTSRPAVQVAQGSIESIMFNLITYKKRPEIVKSCMELLYTLSECRDNVKPIRAANGVEAVVAALYVNKDNEEIQRIGGKVLKNIVSADAVREAVRQLRFHTQNLRNDASKNNESIPGCEKALMALSAFAQSSTQLIGEEGGIDAIVKCLKVTLNSNGLKKSQQQSLLNGVFRTINAMFLYGDSEQVTTQTANMHVVPSCHSNHANRERNVSHRNNIHC